MLMTQGTATKVLVLKKKNGEKLGISLVSLNQAGTGSIYVNNVTTNSPASRENVVVGWELIKVNGKHVKNLTVNDVAQITTSSNEITIKFETIISERYTNWKNLPHRKQAIQFEPPQASKTTVIPKSKSIGKRQLPQTPPKSTQFTPQKDTTQTTSPISISESSSGTTENPQKKKKTKPQANSIHKFLQSTKLSEDNSTSSKQGHHPLQELTRAEKSRKSMFIERLTFMGFSKADAELSCDKCGIDNVDSNMYWLISYLEERKFQNDLNQAQIESEQQKRNEDTHNKEKEKEVLQHTTTLRTLFPESVAFDKASNARHVVKLIEKTLATEAATTSIVRQLVVDILDLESKAKKWYKRPAECYVGKLMQRLNATLAKHDVASCCAKAEVESSSKPCVLVEQLEEEMKQLKKHLFDMPTNIGGVPTAFLEADDTFQFSLVDDGFEVCDTHDLVSDDDDDDDEN